MRKWQRYTQEFKDQAVATIERLHQRRGACPRVAGVTRDSLLVARQTRG